MYLKNTSRYSINELRPLLELAAQLGGFELSRVAVHVKNCGGSYRGRAYPSVPYISSAHRSARYLVVLAIGKPERFPVKRSTPYGGKGSPVYQLNTWQEAVVQVAAHEFNHIKQYQINGPRSEVRCERKALEVLEAFREFENRETVRF